MAFLTCHLFSHVLCSNIALNVSLPTPGSGDSMNPDTLGRDFGYEKGLPVAYLLHGMFGDADSWVRYSNIDRYAQDRRIVLVMCSAGNSFYQKMAFGPDYEAFFTRELPAYICSLFPVSPRREDTFIGGFSMGGYGAWHLALTAPEQFSRAASMSGALDLVSLYRDRETNPMLTPFCWEAIFGRKESLEGTSSDLFAQYARCRAAGPVPDLYQACGTEDFLYQMNQGVRDRLLSEKAKLIWNEGPGGHDWTFWDGHIQRVLDWLLEDRGKMQSAVIMG